MCVSMSEMVNGESRPAVAVPAGGDSALARTPASEQRSDRSCRQQQQYAHNATSPVSTSDNQPPARHTPVCHTSVGPVSIFDPVLLSAVIPL